MRDAPQRALDATEHQRYVLERFATTLAVDNGRAVGPLATHVTRRVGIVAANLAVCRVAVDHGVHVARRHAPKQIGLTQHLEGFGALPVRLRNDADPKALRFKHAPNHCHAETRVVHISVTRDQNNIAAVPSQLVHLGAAHRQKPGSTKARGPVLAVAVQGFGAARE